MITNELEHYIKLSQNRDVVELKEAINNDKPISINIQNKNRLTDLISDACYLNMLNHHAFIDDESVANYIKQKMNIYMILVNGKKTIEDIKENDTLLVLPRM